MDPLLACQSPITLSERTEDSLLASIRGIQRLFRPYNGTSVRVICEIALLGPISGTCDREIQIVPQPASFHNMALHAPSHRLSKQTRFAHRQPAKLLSHCETQLAIRHRTVETPSQNKMPPENLCSPRSDRSTGRCSEAGAQLPSTAAPSSSSSVWSRYAP